MKTLALTGKVGFLLLGVWFLFGSTLSQAQTIDFGPLAGPTDTPYSGHVEDGFTITPTGGNWFQAFLFGNPTPDIYAGPIGGPSVSSISVTDGLFNFSSVDLSSNTFAGSEFRIEGLLNGATVFTQNGSIGNANTFNTINSLSPLTAIDRLNIQMTPVRATTSMNLDNIVLEKVAVPEPSTMILLAGSLLGLAGYGRKRMKK